jgi:hypothetical protein
MNDARYPLYRLNQRYALAALYYSTNGDSWVENLKWLSKDHECEWYLGSSGDFIGGCDEASRLSKLYFFSNNMNGSIPAELELLTNLEQMTLIDRSIRQNCKPDGRSFLPSSLLLTSLFLVVAVVNSST